MNSIRAQKINSKLKNLGAPIPKALVEELERRIERVERVSMLNLQTGLVGIGDGFYVFKKHHGAAGYRIIVSVVLDQAGSYHAVLHDLLKHDEYDRILQAEELSVPYRSQHHNYQQGTTLAQLHSCFLKPPSEAAERG